ncbi:MAG: hypothetical protein NTW28_27645 [Candidatus Solibacter sp.]|nr:hypothetical protein [Candidatus Solibacter sp.]
MIDRPVGDWRESSRAVKTLVLLIAAMCAMHVAYLTLSRMVPSTDEAHYMSGALYLAEGVRSGTFAGAWNGYINGLGFKAPLVTIPAAALMLLFGGLVLPSNLSLVATFAAVGLAAFRLFRRCVRPSLAVAATGILLAAPMVTGLTHRFYVELLLLALCIWYLDVLAQNPWQRTFASCRLGLVAGLGVLCKLTFPGLVALPTLYSLYTYRAAFTGSPRQVLRSMLNVLLAGAVALAVAGPWYARNFKAVWEHSKMAASGQVYYYPHWVQADLSSGPNLFVAGAAFAALFLVGRDLMRRRIDPAAAHVWILILLLGFATALACATTVNKATRFSVTWLPAFALLSAVLWDYCPVQTLRKYGVYALAGLSLLLSVQISFGILPIAPVRTGDLVLFSSRFPLNIPGWFDDNHPLDRRDFRLGSIDDLIAADAAKRFSAGQAIHAPMTEFGLLVNYGYLSNLSRFHKHSIEYRGWRGTVTTGPEAPEYIISCKGFKSVYPGVHFFDYYPNIEADMASGRLPYEQVARIDGPEKTRILIYGQKPLASVAETSKQDGKLYIEAEHFNRGNATIDNGEHGYGLNIGVIISLKPPPTFVEYDFELPRDGKYQIELRYASATPRAVRVLLDGTLVTSHAADAVTGGFEPASQQWKPAGVVALKSGKHVLRVESDNVFPHIDQILLAFVQ